MDGRNLRSSKKTGQTGQYESAFLIQFITRDHDPEWRRRPRPTGRFLNSVGIPGNYLAEGTLIVGAWIMTEVPMRIHCRESHVAAFQVVDSVAGDTARGDLGVMMPGVVRPLLPWRNERLSVTPAVAGEPGSTTRSTL